MNMETIVKQTTSFRDDLLKDLVDTEFAMYYIEASIADYKKDGNTESLWMALRDVVEAQAAVPELSKRTGIDAETLSDAISNENVPRSDMLSTILKSFGCKLPVEHMQTGTCIYCNEPNPLNREHAFPQSLRQENTPGWIIDNHLCKKCNSGFGDIDMVLSQRSNIGFLFDLIQRERGQENKSVYASPYHKPVGGVNPIRVPFPDPLYDNRIVLHEPDSMNHELNYMGFKALQPQMILTQYRDEQTGKEVVEENHRKFYDKSLHTNNQIVYDEQDDVLCFFGNTYVFPPKTTQRYLANVDDFKSKYMTDYPHTRYDLWVLSPEEGRGEQKFFDFFNALQGESKQMIEEDRNLKTDIFRKPIQVIPDQNIKLLSNRAIAKLAFHCFLCHYPKFTGHETMFNSVKNFIYQGSGTSSKFVKAVVTNENLKSFVYKDTEHQHYFGFFIKDKNIGCQIDLFTGLTTDAFSYNVVLAGNPDKKCSHPDNVEPFPFFVHQKSPSKKKNRTSKGKIVSPGEVGIIRPSQWSDLLWLRK